LSNMTSTPPENNGMFSGADSWVDLSSLAGQQSPNRITPVPFGGEQDYLRMLREAQRESNRSSAKVSPITSALMSLSSTTRNSPTTSPKSPPNSPNPELAAFTEELKGIYINRLNERTSGGGGGSCQTVSASELIWDWSSRPNVPPKEWKLPGVVRSRKSSSSSKLSSNSTNKAGHGNNAGGADDEKKPGYSNKIIYTLLLTNLLSLILGAGIGMWLSRSSSGNNNLIDIPI
jgi:BCL2/adenovirus E1B protein-interacting protein 3